MFIKQIIKCYKRDGFVLTCKRISARLQRLFWGSTYLLEKEYFNDDVLHIAFYPSGGLGDYIISRVILEEVLSHVACKYKVTLFCDKPEFGKSIYGDITEDIKLWYEYDRDCYKYDLAFWVEHFVHVDSIKKNRVMVLSSELYQKCLFIKNNWHDLYVDIERQCFRERVQFERCRVLGLDRWTELRMGGAFDVAEKKVFITLSSDYKKKWEKEFSGKRYITINYGADAMVQGLKQLKMWTVPHYERLIELIKVTYPTIEVVQLGDKEATAISGVDKTVFGESIEYVKYILKNSLLHIDCEGGLVHLATQLEKKCVVLFGPTPVHMYGYDQNINIVSPYCDNCMGLHDMWAYECYHKHDNAACMEAITPDMVMDIIKKEKVI